MENSNELTITRTLNAPQERVFKVWTDPAHLAKWWGPHGFSNPVCELDLKPGGQLLIHMQAPDGVVYPMTGTFAEIIPNECLVFTSNALDTQGEPLFEVLNIITFAAQGAKTVLTLSVSVSKIRPEAKPYLDGMQQGWTESLERLEAYVTNI